MKFLVRFLLPVFAVALPIATTGATDPSGFSGHAAVELDATTPKGQFAIQGAAAFERRGTQVRVDLLSLSLTDRAKGAAFPNPLPPGGYSIVFDTATMVYTLWSPSRRTYYTGKGKPSPVAATPTPSPSPAPSASPEKGIASFLGSLKDLRQFVLSVSLAPEKTPIDGHPTTNFDFKFTRAVKTEDPVDITGRASFADDLGGVPILVLAKATNGSATGANLRAALSDITQKLPAQSDFAPPPGYARGASILDVIVIPQLPTGS